jgi:hypothetical protein
MLEAFLSEIGLHRAGGPLDCRQLLDPFSHWVDAQPAIEAERFYLASRLAVFICEYLIQVCAGQRIIEHGRIKMLVPIQQGFQREFDPYLVAIALATNRTSLKAFLDAVCQ